MVTRIGVKSRWQYVIFELFFVLLVFCFVLYSLHTQFFSFIAKRFDFFFFFFFFSTTSTSKQTMPWTTSNAKIVLPTAVAIAASVPGVLIWWQMRKL
jgi:hypothetical protein